MSEGVEPARMRASDADRERVLEVLHAAAGDGRLESEEYGERVERVRAARTLGELVPVTSDLLPAEQQPIHVADRPVMAVFRGEERKGRWVVPPQQVAFALGATAKLDLREALLTRRHVRLHASALCGRVRIRVPDDVEVRVRGWCFLGSRSTTAGRPRVADPPVLEIHGFSLLGAVRVQAPKRKRGWLRRRRNRPELR